MSRGNAGAVQRAEPEAAAAPSDYAAVFEQAAPACLLLRPDPPRFSVAAASAAFLNATGAEPRLAAGSSLSDVLVARGIAIDEGCRRALLDALERAASAGVSACLPLAAPAARSAGEAASSAAAAISPSARAPFVEARLTPVRRGGAVHLIALHLRSSLDVEGHTSEPGTSAALRLAQCARELEHTRAELASARAELEAFGYSVSHDLRSPLRAIDGFAQALAQDCGGMLDERASHHLERVQAGARRMSALLDDLLALSKIQLAPLERTRIDVSELASRLATSLTSQHPERALRVEVESGLSAWADPRLFQILLTQLLDNACKFTSKKPSATIRVGREASAAASALFVADDGAGFDMAHARRLFSPFQRLHRAADYPGNGIGLAIARRIVMRHGGRIWARATPDQGACLLFSLEERETGG